MPDESRTTPATRHVRTEPVAIPVGYRGEVVAGNGRVMHRTRPYLTRAGAERAARRWVAERTPKWMPPLAGGQP